jgi:hypothetical protein
MYPDKVGSPSPRPLWAFDGVAERTRKTKARKELQRAKQKGTDTEVSILIGQNTLTSQDLQTALNDRRLVLPK